MPVKSHRRTIHFIQRASFGYDRQAMFIAAHLVAFAGDAFTKTEIMAADHRTAMLTQGITLPNNGFQGLFLRVSYINERLSGGTWHKSLSQFLRTNQAVFTYRCGKIGKRKRLAGRPLHLMRAFKTEQTRAVKMDFSLRRQANVAAAAAQSDAIFGGKLQMSLR